MTDDDNNDDANNDDDHHVDVDDDDDHDVENNDVDDDDKNDDDHDVDVDDDVDDHDVDDDHDIHDDDTYDVDDDGHDVDNNDVDDDDNKHNDDHDVDVDDGDNHDIDDDPDIDVCLMTRAPTGTASTSWTSSSRRGRSSTCRAKLSHCSPPWVEQIETGQDDLIILTHNKNTVLTGTRVCWQHQLRRPTTVFVIDGSLRLRAAAADAAARSHGAHLRRRPRAAARHGARHCRLGLTKSSGRHFDHAIHDYRRVRVTINT